MTMQYEQTQINLEGVSATSSIIFDPSATGNSDTVYSSWTSMLAAAQARQSIVEIIVRGTGLVTIPPGTYDMTDIVLSGETPFTFAIVNDVVFQNLLVVKSIILAVGIGGANLVPTFQYSDGASHQLTVDLAQFLVGPLATAPMFALSAGTSLGLTATHGAFLSTNLGVPVFTVDATSAVTTAGASNNWGGGPASPPFLTVALGGAFVLSLVTGDIFWVANQVTPPTTITYRDDYAEAVLANWAGVAPLNVKNALDRIAALVGPVP